MRHPAGPVTNERAPQSVLVSATPSHSTGSPWLSRALSAYRALRAVQLPPASAPLARRELCTYQPSGLPSVPILNDAHLLGGALLTHHCPWGIAVIAGTGSVVVALDVREDGDVTQIGRRGGLGYLLGDDGSGEQASTLIFITISFSSSSLTQTSSQSSSSS